MTRRMICWFGLTLACMGGVASADDPKPGDIAGTWEGTLKAGGAELRLVLHLNADDSGALSASMDSPDQGAEGMKVGDVDLTGDRLSLALVVEKARFTGTVNAEATEIVGEWKQSGTLPITFRRVDPAEAARRPEAPEALAGLWAGELEGLPGGITLRVVLNVAKDDEGRLLAKLDSPDQGVKGLPASALTLNDGVLAFEVKAVGAKFEGTLDEKANAYRGKFRQAGQTFGLTLAKTDAVAETKHPQTPKPPFPYRSEDVTYRNAGADVTLAGTLTLPEGDGPFPAALLITGSGAQDRDETLLGHKPFLVLADALTRRGIAVLRVDDRGVGGSTGDAAKSTSEDFAGDVRAGVGFLRQHPEIDPKRVGLIGHSEGGLIAPMVAADSDQVAFIVLMAGPGLNGEEILRLQSHLIASAMGAEESSLAIQAELLDTLFKVLRDEPDDDAARARMKERMTQAMARLPESEREKLAENEGAATASLERLASPWFRYFLRYDPKPNLEKVRCPVLAINGGNDLQVPPRENLKAIAEALKAGGNDRATLKELPGLNHLFQTSRTGAPAEYSRIEETIAPQALDLIGDWILEQVGTPAP